MKVTISCSATWSGKLKDVNNLSVCQDAAPDHSRDSHVTRDLRQQALEAQYSLHPG